MSKSTYSNRNRISATRMRPSVAAELAARELAAAGTGLNSNRAQRNPMAYGMGMPKTPSLEAESLIENINNIDQQLAEIKRHLTASHLSSVERRELYKRKTELEGERHALISELNEYKIPEDLQSNYNILINRPTARDREVVSDSFLQENTSSAASDESSRSGFLNMLKSFLPPNKQEEVINIDPESLFTQVSDGAEKRSGDTQFVNPFSDIIEEGKKTPYLSCTAKQVQKAVETTRAARNKGKVDITVDGLVLAFHPQQKKILIYINASNLHILEEYAQLNRQFKTKSNSSHRGNCFSCYSLSVASETISFEEYLYDKYLASLDIEGRVLPYKILLDELAFSSSDESNSTTSNRDKIRQYISVILSGPIEKENPKSTTRRYENIDLSEINVNELFVTGVINNINLSQSQINKLTIEEAELRKVNFSSAKISDGIFIGTPLKTELQEVNFDQVISDRGLSFIDIRSDDKTEFTFAPATFVTVSGITNVTPVNKYTFAERSEEVDCDRRLEELNQAVSCFNIELDKLGPEYQLIKESLQEFNEGYDRFDSSWMLNPITERNTTASSATMSRVATPSPNRLSPYRSFVSPRTNPLHLSAARGESNSNGETQRSYTNSSANSVRSSMREGLEEGDRKAHSFTFGSSATARPFGATSSPRRAPQENYVQVPQIIPIETDDILVFSHIEDDKVPVISLQNTVVLELYMTLGNLRSEETEALKQAYDNINASDISAAKGKFRNFIKHLINTKTEFELYRDLVNSPFDPVVTFTQLGNLQADDPTRKLDLSGGNFSYCNFEGLVINGENVSLLSANLEGANLSKVRFSNIDISELIVSYKTEKTEIIPQVIRTGHSIEGVWIEKEANLSDEPNYGNRATNKNIQRCLVEYDSENNEFKIINIFSPETHRNNQIEDGSVALARIAGGVAASATLFSGTAGAISAGVVYKVTNYFIYRLLQTTTKRQEIGGEHSRLGDLLGSLGEQEARIIKSLYHKIDNFVPDSMRKPPMMMSMEEITAFVKTEVNNGNLHPVLPIVQSRSDEVRGERIVALGVASTIATSALVSGKATLLASLAYGAATYLASRGVVSTIRHASRTARGTHDTRNAFGDFFRHIGITWGEIISVDFAKGLLTILVANNLIKDRAVQAAFGAGGALTVANAANRAVLLGKRLRESPVENEQKVKSLVTFLERNKVMAGACYAMGMISMTMAGAFGVSAAFGVSLPSVVWFGLFAFSSVISIGVTARYIDTINRYATPVISWVRDIFSLARFCCKTTSRDTYIQETSKRLFAEQKRILLEEVNSLIGYISYRAEKNMPIPAYVFKKLQQYGRIFDVKGLNDDKELTAHIRRLVSKTMKRNHHSQEEDFYTNRDTILTQAAMKKGRTGAYPHRSARDTHPERQTWGEWANQGIYNVGGKVWDITKGVLSYIPIVSRYIPRTNPSVAEGDEEFTFYRSNIPPAGAREYKIDIGRVDRERGSFNPAREIRVAPSVNSPSTVSTGRSVSDGKIEIKRSYFAARLSTGTSEDTNINVERSNSVGRVNPNSLERRIGQAINYSGFNGEISAGSSNSDRSIKSGSRVIHSVSGRTVDIDRSSSNTSFHTALEVDSAVNLSQGEPTNLNRVQRQVSISSSNSSENSTRRDWMAVRMPLPGAEGRHNRNHASSENRIQAARAGRFVVKEQSRRVDATTKGAACVVS